MKLLDIILEKLGIDKTAEDDHINASTQDAARMHEQAVIELHEATQERKQSNETLRRSINTAKLRTNSFADFEQQIQKEPRRNVRRSD